MRACVCNLVEKLAEAGDFLLQVSSLDHQLVADGLGLLLRVQGEDYLTENNNRLNILIYVVL